MPFLRQLRQATWRVIWEIISFPTVAGTSHRSQTVRIGSPHSSREIIRPHSSVTGGMAICGGAGEDISFEVELARDFGLHVIIVDPVPRAYSHFREVSQRFGGESFAAYSSSGKQSAEAYDLRQVDPDMLSFLPEALWKSEEGKIRLFAPADENHVSFSAINLQGNDDKFLEVPTTTIGNIVRERAGQHLNLVKLDIEGAGLETLECMFEDSIYPDQITLEIDELGYLNFRNFWRARSVLRLLRSHGYLCFWREARDYSFVHQSAPTES